MTILRVDWPHYFPESSRTVRVTAGGQTETLAVDLSSADDWFSAPSPQGADLGAALAAALNSHSQVPGNATAVVGTDFVLDVFSISAALQILWTDPATTLPPEPFGFDGTADTALSTAIAAPYEVAGVWRPGRPPSVDTRDRAYPVGGARSTVLGATRVSHFGLKNAERDVVWSLLPRDVALNEYAAGVGRFNVFERAWNESVGIGRSFYCYDSETGSPVGLYRARSLASALERDSAYRFRWKASLSMTRVS